MSLRLSHLVGAAVLCAAPLLRASDAAACGGCFIPPSSPSVVTGHRMALSISSTQTVLWDQIQYAGEPEDFAWVLPVKPGARIEASTDAFFEVLETESIVNVVQPQFNCDNGGGQGCGAQDEAGSGDGGDAFGGPNGTVDVVHHGTVGPYETVTLATDTPGALNDWLAEHGYNVDDETQPIIDAYVEEGFDFIALRLQPGQGVRQMTPVRIVTEGANPILPLRMVAAGTGAEVAIVLYVIGEGRWETENFPMVVLPLELLSWNFETSESNYAVLRQKALANAGGESWMTAYAQRGTFFQTVAQPLGSGGGFGFGSEFLTVYDQQAFANAETEALCFEEANDWSTLAASTDVVVQPCPAGTPWDDPSCAAIAPGQVDARLFGCEGLDDISTALVGMHPADVWVTRLESNLPRAALAKDLTIQAAERQEEVDNFITARVTLGTENLCASGVPIIWSPDEGAPRSKTTTMWLTIGAGALGLLAITARRRRRSAPLLRTIGDAASASGSR